MVDVVLAAVLTGILGWVNGHWIVSQETGLYLGLSLIPLLWLAFRHGILAPIFTGFVVGLVLGLLKEQTRSWAQVVLYDALPLMMSFIGGFFAKYTQKTLNNRRLSSTYLNIVTGTLASLLAAYLLKFVLLPLIGIQGFPLRASQGMFWVNIVVTALVGVLVFVVMVNIQPSLLIPRRTKFLSRRETSALLND